MNWFSSLMGNLNYWTVFILMYVEGTVIPVPSELIVSPAAYHAAAGHLDVTLVIIFATLGAVLGSATNYVAAYYLGRPIVYKFANSKLGHLCLLNQEKIEKSEKYFNDHGVMATLTGRLLPGIRQVISVPAGLAKMTFWKFMLYTTIGAGIWNCVLAALGWYLHSIVPEEQLNEKILEYNHHIKVVILSLFGMMVAYFIIRRFLNRRKKNKAQSSNPS
jgi:hypothetical protein